jgi:acetyl esterase/lipase
LWPGEPPGGATTWPTEEIIARPRFAGLRDRIVRGVRTPLLTIFRAVQPVGTGVLIAPGGGYTHVVIDKEGFEMARWLAARGCTVAVMRYRLPADGWRAAAQAPLQDAQRALRLLRANAKSLDIEPARIGVMGFSAGGHVAGSLAFKYAEEAYPIVDAIDTVSARPDFAALIYPVITMQAALAHSGSRKQLIGTAPDAAQVARYSLEQHVSAHAPPTFLLHAADDTSVPLANALRVHQALLEARVPVELHAFAEGGHGFGLRAIAGKPVEAWPHLTLNWLARAGFYPRENLGKTING